VLGETIGRLIFGIGVTGAALAAAIVCSLACAWGLGEIFGRRGSRERDTTRSGWFLTGYSACITGSAAIVLFVPDLVWLSVATQVLNAIMLPVVGMLLVIVAATALPPEAVLKGAPLWLTTAMIGLVSAAGLIGAIAGLQ
jgi:Mn2+/Fe2+ NRAMP family transporter